MTTGYAVITVVSGLVAIACALGVGVIIGRRSRDSDVDEAVARAESADAANARHIEYEDQGNALVTKLRGDLQRMQVDNTRLCRELDLRRIGPVPIADRVAKVIPLPPPIPAGYTDWEGSPEGQTGAWSAEAVEKIRQAAALGEEIRTLRLVAETDIEPCHVCTDTTVNTADQFFAKYPHLGRGIVGPRNECDVCKVDQDDRDEVEYFFSTLTVGEFEEIGNADQDVPR